MASSTYPTTTQTTQTKSHKFSTEIPVNPKFVGALIGRGGTNIKRLCRALGFGTFIKAYNSDKGLSVKSKLSECDMLLVETYNKDVLSKARDLIKKEIKLNKNKPSVLVKYEEKDKAAIGYVIGSRGTNIKRIVRFAGAGCFIVHKGDKMGFEVSAKTHAAVQLASQKIRECIDTFHRKTKRQEDDDRFYEEYDDDDGVAAAKDKYFPHDRYSPLDEEQEQEQPVATV